MKFIKILLGLTLISNIAIGVGLYKTYEMSDKSRRAANWAKASASNAEEKAQEAVDYAQEAMEYAYDAANTANNVYSYIQLNNY